MQETTRLALVCLVAILFAGLVMPGIGFLLALLIPIWLFFGFIIVAAAALSPEPNFPLQFTTLPAFSPRPPPAQ